MRVVAAILAAGKGSRFGGDKVMALLGGKRVWRWSYDTFVAHSRIDAVGLVGSVANLDSLRADAADAEFIVTGGENRQESSRIACAIADADIILLHDGARPFVTAEVIDAVLDGALRTGAAAPGAAITDTIRARNDQS